MSNRRSLTQTLTLTAEEPSLQIQNDATSILVMLGNSVKISMSSVVSGLTCAQQQQTSGLASLVSRRELAEGAAATTAATTTAESNRSMDSIMGIGKLHTCMYVLYFCAWF